MSTTVLWVDSDPNIEKSVYFLKEKKFTVKCFNETKVLIIWNNIKVLMYAGL